MRIINWILLFAVIAIAGFLFWEHWTETATKYKYKVVGQTGGGYSMDPPQLWGDSCVKFRNENKKLMVVCGPVSITEL